MPPRTKLADQEPMAQTTVRFPRALLKQARIRAATDEVTLQALLIHALDRELELPGAGVAAGAGRGVEPGSVLGEG